MVLAQRFKWSTSLSLARTAPRHGRVAHGHPGDSMKKTDLYRGHTYTNGSAAKPGRGTRTIMQFHGSMMIGGEFLQNQVFWEDGYARRGQCHILTFARWARKDMTAALERIGKEPPCRHLLIY